VGKYVDLVQIGEDLGTQQGPIMSPASFRKIYKPRMRRLLESIRRKTAARVYLHSCGSIYRFIPDLIECGVQVLNPVQVNAKEMDSARLKREFGQDLTFWGGGCDPVVLGTRTPGEVVADVKRRIDDLAPGGGYVFGSVHNIQANVPRRTSWRCSTLPWSSEVPGARRQRSARIAWPWRKAGEEA
jgi:uroporphyrinogen decarboxylase